jgi:hypothetical protein
MESADDPLQDTLSKFSNTAAADEILAHDLKGALRSGEVPTFGEEMFIELEEAIKATTGGGVIPVLNAGFETPTGNR